VFNLLLVVVSILKNSNASCLITSEDFGNSSILSFNSDAWFGRLGSF
jgi:hypothetical protein